MRDIKLGEEITIDYAMVLYGDPHESPYVMKCYCQKGCCRSIITADDWKCFPCEESRIVRLDASTPDPGDYFCACGPTYMNVLNDDGSITCEPCPVGGYCAFRLKGELAMNYYLTKTLRKFTFGGLFIFFSHYRVAVVLCYRR